MKAALNTFISNIFPANSSAKNNMLLHSSDRALYDLMSLTNGLDSGHLTPYMYMGNNDYFEQLIKNNPDYYLFYDEINIVQKNKDKICELLKNVEVVIDLGPGSKESFTKKTMPVLQGMKKLSTYCSVDVCKNYANQSAKLAKSHVNHIKTEAYTEKFEQFQLDKKHFNKEKVFFLVGSTLGNFKEEEVNTILSNIVKNNMKDKDKVLIAVDTNCSNSSLMKAYNNEYAKRLVFNSIESINKALDNALNLNLFKLDCEWDRQAHSVKFYLSSSEDQYITLNGSKIIIQKNKRYNIVNSYKFYQIYFEKILSDNGLNVLSCLTEENKRMAVYVCQHNKT